jgi:hypothetical protein
MTNTLTTVTLNGTTYSLCYDTEKQEYQVIEQRQYFKEIHVRSTAAAAKGLYTRLTQTK